MNGTELINKSKAWFDHEPVEVHQALSIHVFQYGAQWMHARMNDLSPANTVPFDKSVRFGLYGLLKYGICLGIFLLSSILLSHIHVGLLPLSVLIFYFVEVHFLFLFPLLIDRVPNPVLTSICITYRIGIVQCIITVMQIAFFMMVGLFNLRKPFQNWYIGCLSIVLWYTNDVRDRLYK
ncbi:hypothetical protein QNI19_30490 [Cytophagaceae bacterium DM2B3-1]|uniref:Uncharacterized protein n=1 Tax=Xanthocytophaga flava TaxID=3048013 RepID=A0ABT7CUF7_9BACT|nr:hypothetical protein [Xanthocytophaga flavus]MDJ1497306.1 hypothetical protein [Xanthocytophaga flavus]